MSDEQTGPLYGVRLIESMSLGNGTMLQAMPSRADLVKVRKISERTVAGFEVLTQHYLALKGEIIATREAVEAMRAKMMRERQAAERMYRYLRCDQSDVQVRALLRDYEDARYYEDETKGAGR